VECKQSPVYSSSLLVGVASVAKCWRQKPPNVAFAGSCTLSEYFPSSFIIGYSAYTIHKIFTFSLSVFAFSAQTVLEGNLTCFDHFSVAFAQKWRYFY